MDIQQRLLDELIKYEAIELKPYYDSEGVLTIGIGRDLKDVGINEDEAFFMARNDIKRVLSECESLCKGYWYQLNDARKYVIMNMCFNLGLTRLRGFKNFLGYLEKKKYREAASEMLNSHWASQVKKRAVDLSTIMKTGEFPEDQLDSPECP